MSNTVRMSRNFTVERSDGGGPNYNIRSVRGQVVARVNWINIGGVRVSTDGSMELSPAKVELSNHLGKHDASAPATSHAAGAKITEVEK